MQTTAKKSSRKTEKKEFFRTGSKNAVANFSTENFKVGDIVTVQINAISSQNIGLAELQNGYTVLVPNTQYGETVQAKIQKIFRAFQSSQKNSYAIATKVESNESSSQKSKNSLKFDFSVGQKFQVTIAKNGPLNSGVVPIGKNFLLIVPNTKAGQRVCVKIEKIKENYAFAKCVSSENEMKKQFQSESIGKQFHILIPNSAKTISQYFVLKFQGKFLFIKKNFGVKVGERVQIQIQKETEKVLFAKIQEISPRSEKEKKAIMKESIQKMIQSNMHFGEKAIRCNANMRKYIWYRKKNSGFYANQSTLSSTVSKRNRVSGSAGQRPFVKRGRHFFNLFKTQRCFTQALKQLAKYAAKGKTFLFVGTKKSAASLIAKTALLTNTSFFVNTRWLGGMLTNWKTILKSISQIRPIFKQKQKILQKIFEKRQKIQRQLFTKVYLLRKKSQLFMTKGKVLIQQILRSKNFLIEKSQQFQDQKRKLVAITTEFLKTSKNFKYKKMQIFQQIQHFEMLSFEIFQQKQQLKFQISTNIQKFHEMEQLFTIGQEVAKLKTLIETQNGKNFVAISSEKISTVDQMTTIPNPSNEILKKMIFFISNFKNENLEFLGGNETQRKNSKNFANTLLLSNRPKTSETHESESAQNTKSFFVSKFLNKFLLFLPFLETSMKNVHAALTHQKTVYVQLEKVLKTVFKAKTDFIELYKKVGSQYQKISAKFFMQKKNFQQFQKNLQQFVSEQRLLKFLPKLRYLPTSKKKMYEMVEVFMKKFVDPKLSYPMEQIYDQNLKFTSKKIAAIRKQKWQRLEKYFGGITKMAKMNTKQISKTVAIIIGQQEEMNAIHECRKLGMKIFAVVDTNCNPKFVDFIIPANDDSRTSIKYILGEMLTYIRLGQKLRKKVAGVSTRTKIKKTNFRSFS